MKPVLCKGNCGRILTLEQMEGKGFCLWCQKVGEAHAKSLKERLEKVEDEDE